MAVSVASSIWDGVVASKALGVKSLIAFGSASYLGPPPPKKLTVTVATSLCLSSGITPTAPIDAKIKRKIKTFFPFSQKDKTSPAKTATKETQAAVKPKRAKEESPTIINPNLGRKIFLEKFQSLSGR